MTFDRPICPNRRRVCLLPSQEPWHESGVLIGMCFLCLGFVRITDDVAHQMTYALERRRGRTDTVVSPTVCTT